GRFFIVGGQKAYVAEKAEEFTNAQGRTDARLRVIFDNGTESNMLLRSLQRALNEDDAGRRITDSTAGPLFSDAASDGDEASGTIYVLRSMSELPLIAENRDLVHKIGVTNLSVEKRIAGARLQPTFLMAEVEIVARYELYNINRAKLENLIHRIFDPARLDIKIQDRFGNPVVPREWFLVPLHAINEAVEKIKDGSITEYVYDPAQAQLRHREQGE
ncbi:MAG: GIY-YIG nuclease family protein, partial [Alphaproteobacteria bacterium]|nr:GIY-YIG nuclease family protein [Alphaproteobacteria bacterium]